MPEQATNPKTRTSSGNINLLHQHLLMQQAEKKQQQQQQQQ